MIAVLYKSGVISVDQLTAPAFSRDRILFSMQLTICMTFMADVCE